MSKKQKILFIFPPVASPVSPYLSLPLLAGQLETAGFDVTCLDLSVDFFDYVLDKKFLLNTFTCPLEAFSVSSILDTLATLMVITSVAESLSCLQ